MQKQLYKMAYGFAGRESQIEWHNEKIPLFVARAAKELGGNGKALDIGCGTGVLSVFMAQQGLQVTALDYVGGALDFARTRAGVFGVEGIDFIEADVTIWDSADKYNLIIDIGCLHNLSGKRRGNYKQQLLRWMPANAHYILCHLGKRHFLDFNHFMILERKTKDEIEAFFSPELQLCDFTADNSFFWYDFLRLG